MNFRKMVPRLAVSTAMLPMAVLTAMGQSGAPTAATGCYLGGRIEHVVAITFDNVHFSRDNPNVPSDLEMLPALEHFIESNGVMLSNNHTPLIARDSLTTYTGLYGDRGGVPISNKYGTYNSDGTTSFASSFAYWTDPILESNPGRDTNPNMVYSPVPPATSPQPIAPTTVAPAPWVPWTRAGCNVGEVATPNVVLENLDFDISNVFGLTSPEAQQLVNDHNFFKDAETADYIGLAIHCARGNVVCANAQAVKYNQTTPSPTEVADLLPDEPGGYLGYDALFGHRYIAPLLGAGTPNLTHNGFQVTDAAGNLVDETGVEIDGAFLLNYPGFPGSATMTINASQTLAYMADLQESGVPVTLGYIADLHDNEFISSLSVSGGACYNVTSALGSGSPCYVAQAQFYNQAFATFFARLAADGITPSNTLFVFSADEGDHEAGANVGRGIQPTPATCDGATVSGETVTPDVACTYPVGTFGELSVNVTGLLAVEKSDLTPFAMEFDTAPDFYVTGNPASSSSVVRSLERDVAGLTAANPYVGDSSQTIANYLADPTEEAILHMVNADPARTPTFTMFAKPDYFLSPGAPNCNLPCLAQNPFFAWNQGAYAAEIDNNWVGFVGPGVANLGLDGSTPEQGPTSSGPDSGQITPVQVKNPGTWVDEADIQPTMLFLAGLSDDYVPDGRVISEILAKGVAPLLNVPGTEKLATCYKQLNSSVGQFAGATIIADTNAIEGTSTNDAAYQAVVAALLKLETARDTLANVVKDQLANAAFRLQPIPPPVSQPETTACQSLIDEAKALGTLATSAGAGIP